MRVSGGITIGFGYDVVGRVGRGDPRIYSFREETEVAVPVLEGDEAPTVATLVRPDLGTVSYRYADGVLIRSCVAENAEPMTVERLRDVHDDDFEGTCLDYPSPPHVGKTQCRTALDLGDPPPGLRAVTVDRSAEARVAAAAFFGSLRIVDGILHKPCAPPAWGVTFRDRPFVAPCVPDLDLPFLTRDLRDWRPCVWDPCHLLDPRVAAHEASEAFRACGIESAFGDGQDIEVTGNLPETDLERASAWLLRRRLESEKFSDLWRTLEPVHRLTSATLDVACGRYLGEVDGPGSHDALLAACAGHDTDDGLASAWSGFHRVATLLAERAEREMSFLTAFR